MTNVTAFATGGAGLLFFPALPFCVHYRFDLNCPVEIVQYFRGPVMILAG